MPAARKHLVDDSTPSSFHCISRCVRRAFLCGDEAEYRRDWVRDAIRTPAGAFAIDVLAYAVMSNHLHLVIRSDPHRVTEWTADTVARRWAMAHPRIGADGHPVAWSEPDLAARAADAAWVAKTRTRLGSLSWFMKSIKERLARRANRADRCTGHFWEGRFQWRLWTGDYGLDWRLWTGHSHSVRRTGCHCGARISTISTDPRAVRWVVDVLSGDGHAAHPGDGTGVARGYDLSIAVLSIAVYSCPLLQ